MDEVLCKSLCGRGGPECAAGLQGMAQCDGTVPGVDALAAIVRAQRRSLVMPCAEEDSVSSIASNCARQGAGHPF